MRSRWLSTTHDGTRRRSCGQGRRRGESVGASTSAVCAGVSADSADSEIRGTAEYRDRALAGLSGRVIEVGAGNGMNFAHYPGTVAEVVAVEPDDHLRRLAKRAAANEVTLSALLELMGKIFSPKNPPTLSYRAANCPGAQAGPPALIALIENPQVCSPKFLTCEQRSV